MSMSTLSTLPSNKSLTVPAHKSLRATCSMSTCGVGPSQKTELTLISSSHPNLKSNIKNSFQVIDIDNIEFN